MKNRYQTRRIGVLATLCGNVGSIGQRLVTNSAKDRGVENEMGDVRFRKQSEKPGGG